MLLYAVRHVEGVHHRQDVMMLQMKLYVNDFLEKVTIVQIYAELALSFSP